MNYSNRREAAKFSQHAFQKTVKMSGTAPRVLISRSAYTTMWHYVDIAQNEVGWLGATKKVGNDYLIEEVFLFKQNVSGTTCEITAEGLTELALELIKSRPDGADVVDRLCFWGHSHVDMATNPSPQDEQQMEAFQENGPEFFIRGILNKRGRMEFTIFLYNIGVKIVDAEWSVYEPIDDSSRAAIEAEFEAKVKNNFPSYKPYIPSYEGYVNQTQLDKNDDQSSSGPSERRGSGWWTKNQQERAKQRAGMVTEIINEPTTIILPDSVLPFPPSNISVPVVIVEEEPVVDGGIVVNNSLTAVNAEDPSKEGWDVC